MPKPKAELETPNTEIKIDKESEISYQEGFAKPIEDPVVALEEKPIKQEPKYNFHLVVNSPFDNYKKGQRIFDETAIDKILACHQFQLCVKVINK